MFEEEESIVPDDQERNQNQQVRHGPHSDPGAGKNHVSRPLRGLLPFIQNPQSRGSGLRRGVGVVSNRHGSYGEERILAFTGRDGDYGTSHAIRTDTFPPDQLAEIVRYLPPFGFAIWQRCIAGGTKPLWKNLAMNERRPAQGWGCKGARYCLQCGAVKTENETYDPCHCWNPSHAKT